MLALFFSFVFIPSNASAETVTALCFISGANLFGKDNLPNIPINCYSKDGENDYANLIEALKDAWKPLSVGGGHGDATIKSYLGQGSISTYDHSDVQSAGIIMEKSSE
ncbi:hypothetical protein D5018_03340 [Parashewanella curva]|uniref:Uncharacterized protein n=1 Tax=Parashewanella curva TaxID=2338552 RepID=A0A3L8Q2M7_9GAMM|nr:hypothetical protein [Parashewanella curva]RLV61143.1 hypothetical protein D5018_03340 [Parashewanella curva]